MVGQKGEENKRNSKLHNRLLKKRRNKRIKKDGTSP
jgi:hypothetical protein